MNDPQIRNATRVRIELITPSLMDIFERLCEQVVTDFVGSVDDAAGSQAAWRRLIHWQRFFEAADQYGLPAEAQIGLYGELVFIRHGLANNLNAGRLVSAWQGPARANQDFAFGRVAVEIKTTAAVNSTKVCISNIRQLDDNGIGLLVLTQVAVDRRKGTGETLPSIVADILSKLDELSGADFINCLTDSGYVESQAHLYIEFGYTLRHVRHFRVTDQFPRILEKGLAMGISDVSYTVELSTATDHLISEETLMNALLE